jgi:hypothetical protein
LDSVYYRSRVLVCYGSLLVILTSSLNHNLAKVEIALKLTFLLVMAW